MIRNLPYLRSFDPKLYEAISDLIQQQSNVAEQGNGNLTGQPLAPPSIGGLKVTGQNGHFQFSIQDQGDIYRDVHYYAEHADNPHFTDAHVIHMGHSRNGSIYLGNVTRYWRAYSAYASSAPGSPAYHGGAFAPQAVNGGGLIGGPDFLPSESSGTGKPGQGISGPGPVPFRSTTGVPPVRGEDSGVAAGGGTAMISPAAAGAPPASPGASGTGGGDSGGGSSLINVDVRTLAAGVNTINAPPGGLLWILFLKMPGAGTATIAWGAGITYASVNIDATISTASPFVFAFDGATGGWYMIVQGATGMAV